MLFFKALFRPVCTFLVKWDQDGWNSLKGSLLLLPIIFLAWFPVSPWSAEGLRMNALTDASRAATEHLRHVVSATWGYNRPAVITALDEVQTTYIAGGGMDDEVQGEIRRLRDWAVSAQTVADMQQFLVEVRSEYKKLGFSISSPIPGSYMTQIDCVPFFLVYLISWLLAYVLLLCFCPWQSVNRFFDRHGLIAT